MVIGLDGLTLEVLLPLVEKGELPNFSRCLSNGSYGVLHSVTNMTTGSTWASFATGCSPQMHGIIHDFHHRPDSYQLIPTSGRDCQRPPFWNTVTEMGGTSIVLNVPHTYPAQPVRGVILTGIDTPSERASGFDYPRGAYRKLRRAGIDYIIDCGLASFIQNSQIKAGRMALERETEARTRAAEYFMRQVNWDLFVTVYSLPDVWQHYYWSSLNSENDQPGRELIMSGYRLLDQHLGRLLSHLPSDGVCIICSDHGFGPLCGTRDSLNAWLSEKGWLKRLRDQPRDSRGHIATWLLDQARKHVSFRLRQQVLASIPALRRRVESKLRMGGIDWARTEVYAALDHQELWINLKGRQPLGRIERSDYDRLCEDISSALLSWSDKSTGKPIITAVHRQPYINYNNGSVLPPDLLLEWNPEAVHASPHPLITGDHAPQGTIIITGAGIPHQILTPCSLIDVAPIVLQALGLSIPVTLEGQVPAGLLSNL